jgi:hypothetical protein
MTAHRFVWLPLPYELPPDNTPIWRYLDFAKFVLLLTERSLFFCRADLLGDKFELAKGIRGRTRNRSYASEEINNAVRPYGAMVQSA